MRNADVPKRCACCGRVYACEADYFRMTEALGSRASSIKAVNDDIDGACVELYRNCSGGSTLLALFSHRRDPTEASNERRRRFGVLLD